jgi:hypothetical protein
MDYRSPAGFDRTRNAVIGHKDFDLTYLGKNHHTLHDICNQWSTKTYSVFMNWQFTPNIL